MNKNNTLLFDPSQFTILIVDDGPRNIQVLGTLLKDCSYKVEYAINADTALKLLGQVKIDLILLDIMMPVIDGFELSRMIKRDATISHIPFIFLTAKTDQDSIIKGFEMGGQDYITKPFNKQELLARVRTQLELKMSREKLENTNKWLEEQVAERTQQLSLANQQLLKLDETKSQFLNIISHEIRTPLSGIIGSVDMIKDQLENDDLSDFVNILNDSSKRLEKFSYKALDISSLQLRGDKIMSYKKHCLEDIIEGVIAQKGEALRKKNLSLSTLSSEKHIALVDNVYLQKCISLIIDNAIQFSLKDATIKVFIEQKNEQHVLTIMNNGQQFPESYDINMAGPFETRSHTDQNPSLSLYLCKLIVDNHKGTIKNQDHRQGASIEICLPCH